MQNCQWWSAILWFWKNTASPRQPSIAATTSFVELERWGCNVCKISRTSLIFLWYSIVCLLSRLTFPLLWIEVLDLLWSNKYFVSRIDLQFRIPKSAILLKRLSSLPFACIYVSVLLEENHERHTRTNDLQKALELSQCSYSIIRYKPASHLENFRFL